VQYRREAVANPPFWNWPDHSPSSLPSAGWGKGTFRTWPSSTLWRLCWRHPPKCQAPRTRTIRRSRQNRLKTMTTRP